MSKDTHMEDFWLAQTKRLAALASSGAHFTTGVFDRERYDEIAQIAGEMLARLGQHPPGPIPGLFDQHGLGYATPCLDVRGVVIDKDRLLMVREKDDGLWALPGGYTDVGLSPAENIVKEIREEAALSVQVTRFLGIRHKARGPYPPDPRDFYKLFFACDIQERLEAGDNSEISEIGYFEETDLPPLSAGRTSLRDIRVAFAQHRGDMDGPFFD